jgi:hypothetical protein
VKQENAEIIGLEALGWLVSNEELAPLFMSATGASLDDLRTGATDSAFLGAVLDFLMQDDRWVIQCCDAIGIAYTQPQIARQLLPGGQQVNWT